LGVVLGSKSTFFYQDSHKLETMWVIAWNYLLLKNYSREQIDIYERAYKYFSLNPSFFDGATVVKDLYDIEGLDLDAMLHDYHYLVYGVAKSFSLKYKADYIYYKNMNRKGKKGFTRFIGLNIISAVFVPYTFFREKVVLQKELFLKEYEILK
jgi:hypothetical protein